MLRPSLDGMRASAIAFSLLLASAAFVSLAPAAAAEPSCSQTYHSPFQDGYFCTDVKGGKIGCKVYTETRGGEGSSKSCIA